jgi:putative ABC transport system permease protein
MRSTALTVLWENVRIAFEQLRAHKVRSLLTALGVIIGIIAVTLMGTAIQGINKGFSDSLDMLGQDLLYVERWPWRDVGDDWALFRNRPHMQIEYAAAINNAIAANPQSVLRVAVPCAFTGRSISREGRSISNVQITGTQADFALINTAEIEFGRFFTHAEESSGRNTIVLGYEVADGLFPEGRETALDTTVRISGIAYEVVGVLARQGEFLGLQSFDKQAIIPLRSLRKFTDTRRNVQLRVQARPGVTMAAASDELTGIMRGIRGLLPEQPNDFEINQSEALEEQLGPVKSGITLAGFFITGLALFVGAIGIMNITFVSVRERTREIGTRRALGARREAILLQFLFEAVAVCLFGGLIGLGLAYGGNHVLMRLFPSFPFIFSPTLVLIAMLLSVFTGIASGLAPAWQASRLDPANALRHE